MKAVLCPQPGRLEVVDRTPIETVPDGWVRLAVSHVGICGTDYHIFAGKHPFLEYPRVMGHEISATVMAGGKGTTMAPGTRRATSTPASASDDDDAHLRC